MVIDFFVVSLGKHCPRAEFFNRNSNVHALKNLLKWRFGFAIEVAIHRMGNRPGTKIPGKWERKWKMAPGLKWPRNMATEMEKMANKSHFGVHFSVSVAIFRPFQAWGHFPFSFPFSRDFCVGPVSHSVYGHFNRKRGEEKGFPLQGHRSPYGWICSLLGLV